MSGKLYAVLLVAFLVALVSCAERERGELSPGTQAILERAELDPFMGDWRGRWRLDDGSESGWLVAQVIALGNGKYRAKMVEDMYVKVTPYAVIDGQQEGDKVSFAGDAQYEDIALAVQAAIADGKFTGKFKERGEANQGIAGSFVMDKAVIVPSTLGAKPPKGAIVLFDGKNFDGWKVAGKKPGEDSVKWRLVDGAMEIVPGTGSIISRKEFADCKLHLEFRTPFMPEARGQGRGNSGVYLQGRYEVQVLDSYGLEGESNECGGIYGVAAPLVNMFAPPMQWQTYDITFSSPRFDSGGKIVKEARMTVIHNGKQIHDNVKVSKATTAAPGGDITQRGGVYLQDHGNRVQYRNVWLVEIPEKGA